MTGLRSWNRRYIWRNGKFVVLVDDALEQDHPLKRLRQVEYAAYLEERTHWETRITEEQTDFASAGIPTCTCSVSNNVLDR